NPKSPSGLQTIIRPEPVSALVTAPQVAEKIKARNGYFLQIGAFRERERAEILAKLINEKGFDVFVEQISPAKDQIAFRVRMGPYADLPEAQAMAAEVLSKSGQRPLISPPQYGSDDAS